MPKGTVAYKLPLKSQRLIRIAPGNFLGVTRSPDEMQCFVRFVHGNRAFPAGCLAALSFWKGDEDLIHLRTASVRIGA